MGQDEIMTTHESYVWRLDKQITYEGIESFLAASEY
jgi:hypothetical protein